MRERNVGNVRRTYKCGLCDRTFRADKRTADKLVQLHYAQSHNQSFDANDAIGVHLLSRFQKDQDNMNTVHKVIAGNALHELYGKLAHDVPRRSCVA